MNIKKNKNILMLLCLIDLITHLNVFAGPPPTQEGDVVQERTIRPIVEIVPFKRKLEESIYYFLWLKTGNDKSKIYTPDSDGWIPSISGSPIDLGCNSDMFFGYSEALNTPENERQFVETVDGNIYEYCSYGSGNAGVAADKSFSYEIVEVDQIAIIPALSFAAANSPLKYSAVKAENITSLASNSLVDALWSTSDSNLDISSDNAFTIITDLESPYKEVWLSSSSLGKFPILASLSGETSNNDDATLHVVIDLDVDSNNDESIDNDDDLLELTSPVMSINGQLKEIKLLVDGTIDGGEITLSNIIDDSEVFLWEDLTKSARVNLPKTWSASGVPAKLYFEKVQGDYATLEMKYEKDGKSCADYVKVISSNILLKEVTFSGDKYKRIKKDTGNQGFYCGASDPQWEDKSEVPDGDADDEEDDKFPVCYVAGSKIEISAKWHYDGGNGLNIYLKGEGPDGLTFPQKLASLSGDELTYPTSDCNDVFTINKIKYYNNFTVNWKISYDGGNTWYDAGNSSNQLYVLRGEPQAQLYHTLVHLSCFKAKNTITPSVCIDKIWSVFESEDLTVKRVDGEILKYYDAWNIMNITTSSLLKDADGQCKSWIELFQDMLRVHNLYTGFELKKIVPTDNFGMIVGNYQFIGPGSSWYFPTYTHINIIKQGRSVYDFDDHNTFDWAYEEVKDLTGIPGQGTSNPASVFNSHFVLLRTSTGTYYDPSYGKIYSSLQAIDDVLSGFWDLEVEIFNENSWDIDFNNDGDKNDDIQLPLFHYIENPPGLNIEAL